jgi:hypothetical protein
MAKEKSAPKVPKPKKLARAAAANRVVAELKGKSTLTELAAKVDALVVSSGGPSKIGASRYHVAKALETAAALGVLELVKPTDLFVTRKGGA